MRISLLPVLLVAAVLAGCVTAEERRAEDEENCRSFGFRPGTDAFADCLLSLELDRRAASRAAAARFDLYDDPWIVYRPMPVRPRPRPRAR
ncbi:hypothetical protein [Mesorhizobium xinjiangense]|uniref:hypothetical protein n=1 Tax=Mesorhizobium xinjiangense TaxID=2678685 RepID=UPI0012ECF951|nr:hypothetical protein [Mesorhizobium xinjiangense]